MQIRKDKQNSKAKKTWETKKGKKKSRQNSAKSFQTNTRLVRN